MTVQQPSQLRRQSQLSIGRGARAGQGDFKLVHFALQLLAVHVGGFQLTAQLLDSIIHVGRHFLGAMQLPFKGRNLLQLRLLSPRQSLGLVNGQPRMRKIHHQFGALLVQLGHFLLLYGGRLLRLPEFGL